MIAIPSDIEIANGVTPRPIVDVARDLGLSADDVEPYGKYKAKLPIAITQQPARGRLVLVARHLHASCPRLSRASTSVFS